MLFVFALFSLAVSRELNQTSNADPTITIQGNKFVVDGKQIFLNGADTAWQKQSDYSLGFLGRNYDEGWWRNEFQRYKDNHINIARIWIHGDGSYSPSTNGDGMVTGAVDRFWGDMDNLAGLAQEYKIYIMPTMWSFDMARNSNANLAKQFRDIVNDVNKIQWYNEYFLVPFVKRYESNPYIFGYDLCNECEHIWRDDMCGPQPHDAVVRLLSLMAAAVHQNSKKPVSTGVMWVILNSDKYKSWTDQDKYAGNSYSDDKMKSLGNQYSYFDFYNVHWYQWQGGAGSFFQDDVGTWLDNDNKPAIIGETPGYDVDENGFKVTMADAYLKGYDDGFDGVFGWKNPWEDDGYGTFDGIRKGTNAFYNAHPNLVYPIGQ